jgi:hypothetical protein
MSWAAHGIPFAVCPQGFAMCLWHMANILSLVVLPCNLMVDSPLSSFTPFRNLQGSIKSEIQFTHILQSSTIHISGFPKNQT